MGVFSKTWPTEPDPNQRPKDLKHLNLSTFARLSFSRMALWKLSQNFWNLWIFSENFFNTILAIWRLLFFLVMTNCLMSIFLYNRCVSLPVPVFPLLILSVFLQSPFTKRLNYIIIVFGKISSVISCWAVEWSNWSWVE